MERNVAKMITPDHYYSSVFAIPYKELRARKIRGLIFDLDNTLTAFNEELPNAKIHAFMRHLHNMGFRVCILTNNTTGRLNKWNVDIALPGVANGLKPFTRGVRKAMRLIGTRKHNTVIIGDQLLSDIWAGKNAGITTILVKPITEKDFLFVRAKRVIERLMLRNYFRNLSRG